MSDCLTADEARRITSANDMKGLRSLTRHFEDKIRDAAHDGQRNVLLAYTDCGQYQRSAILQIQSEGFDIVIRRESCGGVLQAPAYYAEW